MKPKASERREIIKFREETDDIEMNKETEQINESSSLFSERINKMINP